MREKYIKIMEAEVILKYVDGESDLRITQLYDVIPICKINKPNILPVGERKVPIDVVGIELSQ